MAKFTKAQVLAEDRTRISAILESPEGRANMTTALELALRTDMQADSARAILATMPAENPFAAAMRAEGTIGIAPAGATSEALGGTSAEGSKEARMAELAKIGSSYASAKGYRAPAA